jgi:hypothetical protein
MKSASRRTSRVLLQILFFEMSNHHLNPNLTSVAVNLINDQSSEVQFYEIVMKVWQDRQWTVS